MGLWGLFISSFLASTLLPGGSEAILLLSSHHNLASSGTLLMIATLGNTLGGMTSWGIGYWLRWRFPDAGLKKPGQQKKSILRQSCDYVKICTCFTYCLQENSNCCVTFV